MSPLTFPDLCAAMDRAGVDVHLVLTDDDRHVLRLRDYGRLRSVEVPVSRSLDAETAILCCSLALCPDGELGRAWPELVALARTAVGAGDVGVSDRGRPERLS